MIFQVFSKKKGLHFCDPRFLRDFQGDFQKKKGLCSSDPSVFANFRVIFTNEKKPGHFNQPAGTPGHGLKTGTVPVKPRRMVNLVTTGYSHM